MQLVRTLCAAFALALSAPAVAMAEERLIVGFDPSASEAARVADLARAGVPQPQQEYRRADNADLDTASIELAPAAARTAAERLQAMPGVDYVERDRRVHVAWDPNDSRVGDQYYLSKISAPAAWDVARGAGVLVAVIDTGVDYNHPDLAGKIVKGPDYVSGDADPMDQQGHGTHVSGVIAAATNNANGIAGVAPDAQVLAIRALDAKGEGYHSWIAAGITHAADRGIKVINLSLGGDSASTTLERAVEYAATKGAIVTCATGNDGAASIGYPARYDDCLAVGATDSSDARASFSNHGSGIDLVAPGASILSTVTGGGYEAWSGTSMAAPVVSGVAAILAGKGLSRSEIISTLQGTAQDLGAAGYDTAHGYGRVNAAAAAGAAVSAPPSGDSAPPVVQSVSLGGVYFVRKVRRSVRWKGVGTSGWSVVSAVRETGRMRWSTVAQRRANVRVVYHYRVQAGVLKVRKVKQKKVRARSITKTAYRTVRIVASDDRKLERVGLHADGTFRGSDSNAAGGWTIAWRCAEGRHTFTGTAYDAAGHSAKKSLVAEVTCGS